MLSMAIIAPSQAQTTSREQAPSASGNYSLLYNTENISWNSCTTIGYRVNLNGMPRGELSRIRKAFDKISSVTALRFQYEGSTTKIPWRENIRTLDADSRTNITFAFSKPGRGPKDSPLWLNTLAAGYGGPQYSPGVGLTGGAVLFDTSFITTVPKASRIAFYMHELGHVVGLGHAAENGELMFPSLPSTVKPVWGAGDVLGLGKIGFGGQPCQQGTPAQSQNIDTKLG